jgi:hypothetical protein
MDEIPWVNWPRVAIAAVVVLVFVALFVAPGWQHPCTKFEERTVEVAKYGKRLDGSPAGPLDKAYRTYKVCVE